MNALEVINRVLRRQDMGDYTAVVDLFADDAVLEDPVFGTFTGREAIAGFMEKMNDVMQERSTSFAASEIAGDGTVGWCQWTATTPAGPIHGCGLYRTRDGLLTYYRDYIQAAERTDT